MSEVVLHKGSHSTIYRRDDGDQPYIIKVLNKRHPNPFQLQQLHNEFELSNGLKLNGIRSAQELSNRDGHPALVLPYISGKTVKEYFIVQEQPLDKVLNLFVDLSAHLAELHGEGIIHRDLSSQNILYNPHTGNVTLIDLGLSTTLDIKQAATTPQDLAGTLAYMAPEQTGRMNRTVDQRSDLYALGVIMYEVLSGQLPFTAADDLELVYSHLARIPTPLHELDTSRRSYQVPEPLSNLVQQLLSKNPEQRYQSADGLHNDVRQMADMWETNQAIPFLELGAHDRATTFRIPEKLYGRESDFRKLEQAFTRARQGETELTLVTGAAGIGKSSLIQELYPAVTEHRGYFLEGKFDQLNQNTPFSALIQALRSFTQQILTESDEQLQQWKRRILKAVGNQGQVITRIIPELNFVIGDQPELTDLGAGESQNRFNYVMQRFLTAITTSGAPIVLFLDDLQWADQNTLELLKSILLSVTDRNLLVIGAYRDQEVSSTHYLQLTLNDLEKEEAAISRVHLDVLSEEATSHLIADTLHTIPDEVRELTEQVYSKTKGNPFFLRQYLNALYQQQILYPVTDQQAFSWSWDSQRLHQVNLSDDVVALLTDRIEELPEVTTYLLRHAACLGNTFSRSLLQSIESAQSEQPLQKRLLPAIQAGFIRPDEESLQVIDTSENGSAKTTEYEHYRFSHDRIQQAFYERTPEEERAQLHLELARQIEQNLSDTVEEENLFNLVGQFNKALSLLNPSERQKVMTLNTRAGQKALNAGAFTPAMRYFKNALDLLEDPEALWNEDYELALSLYNGYVDAAFLNGEVEPLLELTEVVKSHARDPLDKVRVYNILVDVYTADSKYEKAIGQGLEILEELGVTFPSNPSMLHVFSWLGKTKWKLRGKEPQDLAFLPVTDNPYVIEALPIIKRMSPPAFMSGSNLFPLFVFKMVHLSLEHGNTDLSPFGYASYAITLSGVLGDVEQGFEFGKMSKYLIDRLDANDQKDQVLFVNNVFLKHWKQHLNTCIDPLMEAYQLGMRVGNLIGGTWSAYYSLLWQFHTGRNLQDLHKDLKSFSDTFRLYKQDGAHDRTEVLRHLVRNLMGTSDNPKLIGETQEQEDQIKQTLSENDDKAMIFFFHFCKMMLENYLGEAHQAVAYADDAATYLEAVLGQPDVPQFHFHRTLALIQAAREGTIQLNRKRKKQIKKGISSMKKWKKKAPENYEHKYELMQAEWLDYRGKTDEAGPHYAQAQRAAQRHQYIHEEALCSERANRHFETLHGGFIANLHLAKAYELYGAWGAQQKQHQLKEAHAEVLDLHIEDNLLTQSTRGSVDSTSSHAYLDLATIMQTAQALTSEIRLDQLKKRLMELLLENAGAQRGILLLYNDDELWVNAEAHSLSDSKMSISLEREAYEDYNQLSQSVIQYVKRTRTHVVINDARSNEQFSGDTYIISQKPKSIMCLPLLNKGDLIGYIYMENNLTTNAFTPQRINLVSMIAAQLAISLQNVTLYENTQQLNENLRQEMAERKRLEQERIKVEAENLRKSQELEEARRLQLSMLPKHLPDIEGYQMAAFMTTATEVGGDYYDYQLSDDMLTLVVGDATGHGLKAGTIVTAVKSSFGIVGGRYDVDQALGLINQSIKGLDLRLLSMCMIYGNLDIENHRLNFSSAGMPPMLHYKSKEKRITDYVFEATPLGIFSDQMYETQNIPLAPGDTLLLMSDGFPELFNSEGEWLTYERVEEIFREIATQSPDDIIKALQEEIDQWAGNVKPDDDITFFVLQRQA
jgi:predicted ATPase/serine phosphatase RsbU (regulator of sigma subunit)/tRNA A-37 threonylcarbamoyl transferase component Bud32